MMRITAVALAAVAVSACASAPVPADKYARSRAAIQSAEVVNAEKVPNAAVHLTLAKNQHERAKELLKKGDNEQAASFLMRAEADAEVAMNIAREAWVKQDAAQTIAQVQQTKAQMQQQMQEVP